MISMSIVGNNNVLSLVRLGFLPPDFTYDDLKKTIYYILWDHFRFTCSYGEIKSLTPPRVYCNKLKTNCNFESCPIVRNALKDYERKRLRVL